MRALSSADCPELNCQRQTVPSMPPERSGEWVWFGIPYSRETMDELLTTALCDYDLFVWQPAGAEWNSILQVYHVIFMYFLICIFVNEIERRQCQCRVRTGHLRFQFSYGRTIVWFVELSSSIFGFMHLPNENQLEGPYLCRFFLGDPLRFFICDEVSFRMKCYLSYPTSCC